MLDSPQHNFRTTELDPDLLSTPFGVQTVAETARQYFEREMAKERSIEEIRENQVAIQRGIDEMQLSIEHRLRANDVAFLDRAFPDSLTFRRVFGLNPNELLLDCFQRRYASVFILDQLPVQRSMALGPEDAVTAGFLDEWLVRDYCALGYCVVRVPVLSPEERLAFAVDRLSEQGLV